MTEPGSASFQLDGRIATIATERTATELRAREKARSLRRAAFEGELEGQAVGAADQPR